MRARIGAWALAPLLLACGGAAPAAPTAPTAAGGATAAEGTPEHCLAVAGAKHERQPGEPEKITVKHVLVKYAGSKRAPATVTRTREQACLRAEEARKQLEKGMPFADVVKTYSEEPGAATREGSLGAIGRGTLVPAFADAAFELHAGEVSQVVETDFGFHVILRAE